MNKRNYLLNENCYDVIRVFAALQVMLFHFLAHFQIDTLPDFLNDSLHLFSGVIIFFAISGYLITASYDRTIQQLGEKNGKRVYIKKRLMRIYPPLWIAFIVSCICMLLFYRKVIWGSLGQIGAWIIASISFAQFYTPDFFRDYGVGAPNGSLWTICVELQFYIVIMLTYKWLKKADYKIWTVLLGIACIINYVSDRLSYAVPDIIYKLYRMTFIPYAYILFLGMFIYMHRERMLCWLVRGIWLLLLLLGGFSYISRKMEFAQHGVYYSIPIRK